MSRPLNILSNNSRLLILYKGQYVSFIKLPPESIDGQFFLGLTTYDDISDIAEFKTTVSEKNVKLSSAQAYLNFNQQPLTYIEKIPGDDSQGAYGISDCNEESKIELTFEPQNNGTFLIKDTGSKKYFYVSNLLTLSEQNEQTIKLKLIDRTQDSQQASEFTLEVLDDPDNIDILDSKTPPRFFIAPIADNNSHWICAPSGDYSHASDFNIYKPTQFNIHNKGTFIVEIEQDSIDAGWRFAETGEIPDGTLILGESKHLLGITISGKSEHITSKPFAQDGNKTTTSIQISTHGLKANFFSFVFRAKKLDTSGSKKCEVYYSKDPTVTEREPGGGLP